MSCPVISIFADGKKCKESQDYPKIRYESRVHLMITSRVRPRLMLLALLKGHLLSDM